MHQHLFNARLDFDIDGASNEVYETNVDACDEGPDNPWGNAFVPTATRLETEQQAQRNVDAARSRTWKIVNPDKLNAVGQPVGYKLIPGSTPTLLGRPGSSIANRAGFATKNLWVTPYAPDERRAAGDFPNQHEGGDGLPRWTAADRSLVGTDIVVWHTFGVTHVPRPKTGPSCRSSTAASNSCRSDSSTRTRRSTCRRRRRSLPLMTVALICAMPMELKPLVKKLGLARDGGGRDRYGHGHRSRHPIDRCAVRSVPDIDRVVVFGITGAVDE